MMVSIASSAQKYPNPTVGIRENLNTLLELLQGDDLPTKKQIETYFTDMGITIPEIIERNDDDILGLTDTIKNIAEQYQSDPEIYKTNEEVIGKTLIAFLIQQEQKTRESIYTHIKKIQNEKSNPKTKIKEIYPLVQKLFNASQTLLEDKLSHIWKKISNTRTEITNILQGEREKTSPQIKRIITITSIMLIWGMTNNMEKPLPSPPKVGLSQVIGMSDQEREDYMKEIQNTYHISGDTFLNNTDPAISIKEKITPPANTESAPNIINPQKNTVTPSTKPNTQKAQQDIGKIPKENPPIGGKKRNIAPASKLPVGIQKIANPPKKVIMTTKEFQEFPIDDITLRYDHEAWFYEVKKGDNLWKIRKNLKKYENFSYLNDPKYSPGEIQANGKKKKRNKVSARNIPNKIEPGMWIPIPQAQNKRQLDETQLITSVDQAIDNMIKNKKYGRFVSSLQEELGQDQLVRTMIAFAIKESNVGANSLSRYESLYKSYSYSIYHILTEKAKDGSPGPGLRALNNLGYTPGQVIADPVKAGERFRAYRTEKCDELARSKNRTMKGYGKHPHKLFQNIIKLGKIYNGKEIYGKDLKEIFEDPSSYFHPKLNFKKTG